MSIDNIQNEIIQNKALALAELQKTIDYIDRVETEINSLHDYLLEAQQKVSNSADALKQCQVQLSIQIQQNNKLQQQQKQLEKQQSNQQHYNLIQQQSQCEKEISELQAQLTKERDFEQQLENDISKLKTELQNNSSNLKKLEDELKSKEDELTSLSTNLQKSVEQNQNSQMQYNNLNILLENQQSSTKNAAQQPIVIAQHYISDYIKNNENIVENCNEKFDVEQIIRLFKDTSSLEYIQLQTIIKLQYFVRDMNCTIKFNLEKIQISQNQAQVLNELGVQKHFDVIPIIKQVLILRSQTVLASLAYLLVNSLQITQLLQLQSNFEPNNSLMMLITQFQFIQQLMQMNNLQLPDNQYTFAQDKLQPVKIDFVKEIDLIDLINLISFQHSQLQISYFNFKTFDSDPLPQLLPTPNISFNIQPYLVNFKASAVNVNELVNQKTDLQIKNQMLSEKLIQINAEQQIHAQKLNYYLQIKNELNEKLKQMTKMEKISKQKQYIKFEDLQQFSNLNRIQKLYDQINVQHKQMIKPGVEEMINGIDMLQVVWNACK
ncbi:Hypothetical_protein [Hexamita inflata]|uniref:Hypothetical_protein n=1 Tax=Hexamita inflata TaxID=28002 RepID=A0AA86RYC4_9EUKA|nr:Hypothetical protein HINF_LOCUS62425 [Hexamita inflata]